MIDAPSAVTRDRSSRSAVTTTTWSPGRACAVTSTMCESPSAGAVAISTPVTGLICPTLRTRVESGVHSTLEVAYGAALGALVTLVLFQVAP